MKKLLLLIICVAFSATSFAETLKIASWNIAWLGSHEYNQRTDVDYKELARYATQLDADVIALQEVESIEYAQKVFGDSYDYYFSTKDWVQRVGVAVRKSAGSFVKAVEYKALDVGRVRYGMDITLSKDNKDIRLLAVHLKSGCFDKSIASKDLAEMPETKESEKKTKNDCITLAKQVEPLELWVDERAKEETPFIILGDFNRRFSQDIALNQSESSGLWQAIDDDGKEDLFTPTLTQNSACWGGYYKDYIDHIVLDVNAKSKYVDGSFEQLVFDQKYTKALSKSLSDHCPISVKIKL